MNLSAHLAKLLWIFPPVAIFTLILMTDVISISIEPEVQMVSEVQRIAQGELGLLEGAANLLPKALLSQVFQSYGLEEIALRVPGIALVICSLLMWWIFGRKLLGEGLLTSGVLVLCSSLLLPNIIKFSTADAWLLSFQLMNWLSVLYVLKKPGLAWKAVFWISLVLGILTAPLNMGIWTAVLLGTYYFLHQDGKRIQLFLILSIILSVVGIVSLETSPLIGGYAYLGVFGNLKWQVFGMLPWFGFLLAGIKETYDKYRKKEELAVLMVGVFLAALISGGIMLQWVLALLAGKQLLSYFHPKYPYGDWVRGGTVLVVVLVCLVATSSMIWGFAQFSYVGYRAFMMTGGLFWIFSLLGLIGLYIKNHRLITIGLIMSGLLFNFSLWYRLIPIADLSFGWPKQVVEKISTCQHGKKTDKLIIYSDQRKADLLIYAKENFRSVEELGLKDAYNLRVNPGETKLIVTRDTNLFKSLPVPFDTFTPPATFLQENPLIGYQGECE